MPRYHVCVMYKNSVAWEADYPTWEKAAQAAIDTAKTLHLRNISSTHWSNETTSVYLTTGKEQAA